MHAMPCTHATFCMHAQLHAALPFRLLSCCPLPHMSMALTLQLELLRLCREASAEVAAGALPLLQRGTNPNVHEVGQGGSFCGWGGGRGREVGEGAWERRGRGA